MNIRAKYHRWRYDQLWKKIKRNRDKEFAEYKERGENAPWREGEEYLTVRQAKALEDHGYKWWKERQKPGAFVDVTEKVRLDSNFSPKFAQAEFLKRQAVENHDVDSFWYPTDMEKTNVQEDTHTDISWAYCQKGHMHEYHNGVLVAEYRDKKISKHLSVSTRKLATVPRWLFGLKDKTVRPVEECNV